MVTVQRRFRTEYGRNLFNETGGTFNGKTPAKDESLKLRWSNFELCFRSASKLAADAARLNRAHRHWINMEILLKLKTLKHVTTQYKNVASYFAVTFLQPLQTTKVLEPKRSSVTKGLSACLGMLTERGGTTIRTQWLKVGYSKDLCLLCSIQTNMFALLHLA